MAQDIPFSTDALADAEQRSSMGFGISPFDVSGSSQALMGMDPPSDPVRMGDQSGSVQPLLYRNSRGKQPVRDSHIRDPPQPLRSCICRLPAVVQQTQGDFILPQVDERDIVITVARIFPFIDGGFNHGISRESLNYAIEDGPDGQPREWALSCARIASTRYDQVSVTSQPMNTPAGAYESLKNILHGLQPVRIELDANDVWYCDDGCCSRCNHYQKGKHPSEHNQYNTKPTKRYQPGNR